MAILVLVLNNDSGIVLKGGLSGNFNYEYENIKGSTDCQTLEERQAAIADRANYVSTHLVIDLKSTTRAISWMFLILSCYFIYRGFNKSGEQV
ncbi:MAG: hypothetical protein MRQ09_04825 [Candidatus Midichloria sp.]|nr:hypothetical protein [Candidatus Midichloria sp.]